jgi:hypothetical protein
MEEKIKTTYTSKLLKNIYLDPNNYRFIDKKEYKNINDENVLDKKVQQLTQKFIEGTNLVTIEDSDYLNLDKIKNSDKLQEIAKFIIEL